MSETFRGKEDKCSFLTTVVAKQNTMFIYEEDISIFISVIWVLKECVTLKIYMKINKYMYIAITLLKR